MGEAHTFKLANSRAAAQDEGVSRDLQVQSAIEVDQDLAIGGIGTISSDIVNLL